MNKIFKVIWSKARNCYVVVSELAKSHDDGHVRRSRSGVCRKAAVLAAWVLTMGVSGEALAADMPQTYTENWVTYTLVSSSQLTGIYYNNDQKKYAVVQYSDDTYKVKTKVTIEEGKTGAHSYSVNSSENSDSNYNNKGATGDQSLAAGVNASAKRTDAVALGTGAAANGERSIAIGSGANTKDEDAQKDNIAIGTKAYAGGDSSVVIGNGAKTKDQAQNTIVLGKNANGDGSENIVLGTEAKATNSYSIAIGAGAQANNDGDEGSVAIGHGANTNSRSVAIGAKASVTNDESVAIGHNASVPTQYSVAIGSNAKTSGNTYGTAIGYSAESTNQYATALGANAKANHIYDVALGDSSVANGATENDNVKYITINGVQHQFSNAVSQHAVSVGNENLTRQIKRVANGEVSPQSTDAINGSQLYAIAQAITNNTSGGGTTDGVHYYSVNSRNQNENSNYTNHGAIGTDAMAAGVSAKATGVNSMAVGKGAQALANSAVAIGDGAKAEGVGATVIGQYASATGDYATAFGGEQTDTTAAAANNMASGKNAVAFGERTTASGNNSTAFGQETTASEKRATAFGQRTQATNSNATAFGIDTLASGQNATAFGNLTKATAIGATAFGNKNKATGQNATAWGGGDKTVDNGDGTTSKIGTVASGTYATAFGERTAASGESATAFGSDSTASGKNALAFGENSTAAGENSVAALGGTTAQNAANAAAIGKDAQAKLADSVALGSGSVADRQSGTKGYDAATGAESTQTSATWVANANAIAVGNGSNLTRQITGVAAGSQDTDAVNLAQLKEVGKLAKKHTTVSVGNNKADADDFLVKGGNLELKRHTTDGQANYDVALSKDVVLGKEGSLKAGNTTINNDGVETNKVKVGDITITDQGINGGTKQITNIASGIDGKQYTDAKDNNAASIGDVKEIAGDEAGKAADAVKSKSGKNITVKDDHTVNLNDNITLGDETDASKQVSIDGNGAKVTAGDGANKVTVDGSKGQVTIGTGDNAMILGKQANTAGDSNPEKGNYLNGLDNKKWDGKNIQNGRAATEDQLKTVSDKVNSGRVFQGDDEKDVKVGMGDTLKIQGGVKAEDVSKENNIGIVKGVDDTLNIRLAKDLKGLDSVTTGNTTMDNGGLTIKTGDSSHQDITIQQGAVNMGGNKIEGVAPGKVSQDSTDAVNGSQLWQRDQAINGLSGSVNKLGNRINRVGAGAAALAALHPLDFDPDDKWDFAAGYGNYRGANAAAVGAYYRPNEDTMFSIGGSFGGGENMVNAGVSIKLGQGNHVSTSRVAMAKEIKDLRQNVANLNAIVNRQSALIDKLTGTNAGMIKDKGNDLFPDVPANHWAYEYVTKLKHAGILTGYPDGNFDGDRMMTRYEFAAIVYRAIMAGAASNPALNQDGTLDKLANEFSSEMKYIRIDTIAKDKNGKPTIERVRVISDAK